MSEKRLVNAALLVIGNEILSGRTQDLNVAYLAKALNQVGIQLAEVRMIRDEEAVIIAALSETRPRYDYVFTTGGIGPTHDDITSATIAKAFNVPLLRHPEAVKRLRSLYKSDADLTEIRLKMADIPEGATLVDNPVSQAPGYQLENVIVLAGVPKIMQAMLDFVLPTLKGGESFQSRSLKCFAGESIIAPYLSDLAAQYPEVDLGSYPFFSSETGGGTVLVARGSQVDMLDDMRQALQTYCQTQNIQTQIEE